MHGWTVMSMSCITARLMTIYNIGKEELLYKAKSCTENMNRIDLTTEHDILNGPICYWPLMNPDKSIIRRLPKKMQYNRRTQAPIDAPIDEIVTNNARRPHCYTHHDPALVSFNVISYFTRKCKWMNCATENIDRWWNETGHHVDYVSVDLFVPKQLKQIQTSFNCNYQRVLYRRLLENNEYTNYFGSGCKRKPTDNKKVITGKNGIWIKVEHSLVNTPSNKTYWRVPKMFMPIAKSLQLCSIEQNGSSCRGFVYHLYESIEHLTKQMLSLSWARFCLGVTKQPLFIPLLMSFRTQQLFKRRVQNHCWDKTDPHRGRWINYLFLFRVTAWPGWVRSIQRV